MKSLLAQQIEELEAKASAFDALTEKVGELQNFIDAWDSEDPDRLPANHKAKITPVRDLVEFCASNSTGEQE